MATSPFSETVFDFIPNGGRVLDLGCGNGRISKLIQERGYHTYGIDINAKAVAFALARPDLDGIEFSVQDARSTNYPDAFFDAVIEQAVLACMEMPDRAAVLNEVCRILKPDGILSIVEFGIREDLKKRYTSEALVTGEYGTVVVKREDGSKWFWSHNFSEEELNFLIKGAGFEVVQSVHPSFVTRSSKKHPGHQYIVRKMRTV